MTEELERRLAINEDVFRTVNEGIRRGQWPGEPDAPVAFRCECARLGCNELIGLTPSEYEQVRAGPRRFALARGHETPLVETVVEVRGEYVIVEKVGVGGEVADARDPRS
ncbi:MAG: hypothetical protein ABSH51_11270 [Solirubrobacteraceae bacterium]|jgi:hypothetical protein